MRERSLGAGQPRPRRGPRPRPGRAAAGRTRRLRRERRAARRAARARRPARRRGPRRGRPSGSSSSRAGEHAPASAATAASAQWTSSTTRQRGDRSQRLLASHTSPRDRGMHGVAGRRRAPPPRAPSARRPARPRRRGSSLPSRAGAQRREQLAGDAPGGVLLERAAARSQHDAARPRGSAAAASRLTCRSRPGPRRRSRGRRPPAPRRAGGRAPPARRPDRADACTDRDATPVSGRAASRRKFVGAPTMREPASAASIGPGRPTRRTAMTTTERPCSTTATCWGARARSTSGCAGRRGSGSGDRRALLDQVGLGPGRPLPGRRLRPRRDDAADGPAGRARRAACSGSTSTPRSAARPARCCAARGTRQCDVRIHDLTEDAAVPGGAVRPRLRAAAALPPAPAGRRPAPALGRGRARRPPARAGLRRGSRRDRVPALASIDDVGRLIIAGMTAAGCDVRVGSRLPAAVRARPASARPDGTDVAGRLEPLEASGPMLACDPHERPAGRRRARRDHR